MGINLRPPMVADWFDKKVYKKLILKIIKDNLNGNGSNGKKEIWLLPMHPKDLEFAREVYESLDGEKKNVKVIDYSPSIEQFIKVLSHSEADKPS